MRNLSRQVIKHGSNNLIKQLTTSHHTMYRAATLLPSIFKKGFSSNRTSAVVPTSMTREHSIFDPNCPVKMPALSAEDPAEQLKKNLPILADEIIDLKKDLNKTQSRLDITHELFNRTVTLCGASHDVSATTVNTLLAGDGLPTISRFMIAATKGCMPVLIPRENAHSDDNFAGVMVEEASNCVVGYTYNVCKDSDWQLAFRPTADNMEFTINYWQTIVPTRLERATIMRRVGHLYAVINMKEKLIKQIMKPAIYANTRETIIRCKEISNSNIGYTMITPLLVEVLTKLELLAAATLAENAQWHLNDSFWPEENETPYTRYLRYRSGFQVGC